MELFDAPATDPFLGKVLDGRYTLNELLATGATSRVYRAHQDGLDRAVAVKVLNPRAQAVDATFRERFEREAALTSKLKHQHIITVLDYGQTAEGVPYLVMELVEGRTLADLLGREGRLTWARAIRLTEQIARGLAEVHAAGILHRDLKPSNVMLRQEGAKESVKVLDFGLLKAFGDGARQPDLTRKGGVFLATPRYMAPEQARHQASPRSDIYSLGVMLFQMLTGKVPFTSPGAVDVIVQHISEPVPALRSVASGLDTPAAVEAVVRKCLEKKPDDRYQSMEALAEALASAGETTTPQPSSASSLPSSSSNDLPEPVTVMEVPVVAEGWEPPTDEHKLPPHLAAELRASVRSPTPFELPPVPDIRLTPEPMVMAPAAPSPWRPVGWALAAVMVLGAITGAAWVLRHRPSVSGRVHFHVESAPTGATVLRGTERLGETPLEFDVPATQAATAEQELRFELDGFRSATVSASGVGEVHMKARLEPIVP